MQRNSKSNNIVLTGFMGTGKTVIERRLASSLGYDYIDTDDMIEAMAGKDIPSIFREEGESHFRDLPEIFSDDHVDQIVLIGQSAPRVLINGYWAIVLPGCDILTGF